MLTTSVSLLERLRDHNQEQAWERFVELYSPLLLYWARRAGLQSQDAADLVQDVFATLLRRLPEFTYDRSKNFRGWLRTITMNRWRNLLRRRAPANVNGDELDRLASPDEGPLEAFWETEHQQFLMKRALEVMQAEFEPTTWQACFEQVMGGRSGTEVAAQLGISENAAYIAKCRVLRRLREELAGLLD